MGPKALYLARGKNQAGSPGGWIRPFGAYAYFPLLFLGWPEAWAATPQTPAYSKITAEGVRRHHERLDRVRVAQGLEEARKKELLPCLNMLMDTIHWLCGRRAHREAEKILGEIEELNPRFLNLPDLKKKVELLKAGAELDEAGRKDLTVRQKKALEARTGGILHLAEVCYRTGLVGQAFDLVKETLALDPDCAAARRALGQVRAGQVWTTPWAATRLQAGQVYVTGLGWVDREQEAKVKGGEWYEEGRWMRMEEADRRHASFENPWVIETENFILRATAGRLAAMKVAERLEAIRALVFREYLEFFMRRSGDRGAQLLFNLAPPQKMAVFFWGNREDFEKGVTKALGRVDPLLQQSVGFFSMRTHASYFYRIPGASEKHAITVMQHEVTHQITGEFARRPLDLPWIVEGTAEVMEYAHMDREAKLAIPLGQAHQDVAFCRSLAKSGKLANPLQVLSLDSFQFHNDLHRALHYRLSGALCRFFLEMEELSYRIDFLEYFYDRHQGQRADFFDYLGLEPKELEKRFFQYLGERP